MLGRLSRSSSCSAQVLRKLLRTEYCSSSIAKDRRAHVYSFGGGQCRKGREINAVLYEVRALISTGPIDA